ncbi:IS1 family transposase [Xenorhabdus littoralis]|uniref:IS1 family transposase n=1 Tax=Xenorhabdus littoralis TaxID=2582835 RepID=UPI003F6CF3E4
MIFLTLISSERFLLNVFFTQRIKRENLTLRNRIKRLNHKTLGYLKFPEMHDKVIGTFIEREYYV